jgi:hypothetical protein
MKQLVFSVDLEPNKDGSLDGIWDAMEWFDGVVDRGTVFTTYRIADELPELVTELTETHEIGVHVHPREFGHSHDKLATLPADRQRELIETTRAKITDVTGVEPVSFRAGRHSASRETLAVVSDLGFSVDASINIRYDEYFTADQREQTEPFEIEGLLEVPVTYGTLPLVSRCGVRSVFERPVTATASTLRTDRWGCSGLKAVRHVLGNATVGSFYMHPYDATDYHKNITNNGDIFRERVEIFVNLREVTPFVTMRDLQKSRE